MSVAADLAKYKRFPWVDSCCCGLEMSGEVALEVSRYWKRQQRGLQVVEDTELGDKADAQAKAADETVVQTNTLGESLAVW